MPGDATLVSTSPERTLSLGRRLGETLTGGAVIALDAPLGAGKTVFAKGIAAGMMVAETVTSPTYTIISEYSGRLRFVHVDLYRIDSEEEYEQLAVDEFMDAQSVVLIEWPDRAGSALPASTIVIRISIEPAGARRITIPPHLAPIFADE